MELHTIGVKNVCLTATTLVSGFIAHVKANEWLTYVSIAVGIITLISYGQKIYYNWELRRSRRKRQNKH